MIKAVFFDIDGTLISFKTHRVPEDALYALKKLQENGIRIFVSTGRGSDELTELSDISFDGYITLNGQFCCTQSDLIYENTIDREDLKILWALQKKHPFPCGFTTDHGKFFNFRNSLVDEIHELTHNEGHPVGDCTHIVDEKVYQVIAFVSEEEEKALLSQLPNCISARWHPYFADISPKGGTKQLGMQKFLDYYGIDRSETMAFGDGGNDLPMIEFAQIGIAMENGVEEVKAKADYVTEAPDEHGIINALRHYGLID